MKLAIPGYHYHQVGRMVMTGSECDVAWREVLQTSYEDLQLLNIHYGMDGLDLKMSYHTLFSINTHNRIRVEISHFRASRG